jgi:hypothetical protein
MRRPSRRAAIALVIVVTVFTAVVAFASSLNVTSTNLQAGAAVVGQACTGPVATSYTTSGVDAGGNPLIQYVDVNPALAVCTANAAPGYTVTIYLEKGTVGAYTVIGTLTALAVTATATTFTATTAGTGATIISAAILRFDFSVAGGFVATPIKVSDLSNVALVIS